MIRRLLAGAAFSTTLIGGHAWAADEEIQVYMDEMNRPGQFGLDVHTNYVFSNDAPPAYPGEQPSLHRVRITPEFSYGLTPDIELGAYLPLTTLDGDGKFNIDGEKLRVKFIAPRAPDQSWFWGANFELGRVQRRLDVNPWNAELKGIVGWRGGPWTLALNTNVDWAVSGPQTGPATLQLAAKVSYRLSGKTSIGLESYDGVGELRALGRLAGSGHSLYAVADTAIGPWDLDIGLGRGYSGEPDKWTLKVIIGVPIDD